MQVFSDAGLFASRDLNLHERQTDTVSRKYIMIYKYIYIYKMYKYSYEFRK